MTHHPGILCHVHNGVSSHTSSHLPFWQFLRCIPAPSSITLVIAVVHGVLPQQPCSFQHLVFSRVEPEEDQYLQARHTSVLPGLHSGRSRVVWNQGRPSFERTESGCQACILAMQVAWRRGGSIVLRKSGQGCAGYSWGYPWEI